MREKLTKAMADRDGGLVFDAGNLTVEQYAKRWLGDSARGTVRESTFDRYEQTIGLHTVPALGRLKLKALTPAHVRSFYRGRLDFGLAPATIHKMHTCLHKSLAQAEADGLLPRDLTDSLKLPRINREEIDPLTAEEANRLKAARRRRPPRSPLRALHTHRAQAGGSPIPALGGPRPRSRRAQGPAHPHPD